MKILSPAGNLECLKIAVYNGADEVYLGINDFNARNNIDGFNMDNLSEAVDFCHIYGVRVCLAINILFTNEEVKDALKIIVKAYNLGVDAFILQDLGLIKLVSEFYPQIEIHLSTQMAVNNLEGVLALSKYGAKRVVLARETPLKEIKRIKDNCDIEIEYFVQGALCVCFSGNCYLSSKLYQASGNRGRCKQLCRLPFTLEKDGAKIKKGYLLSAKDFNMINRLKDLENAGVDVLKIEGRARRPYYVGATTREYKNALENKKVNQDNLKIAFNREYTEGYFNDNGKVISNLQNHIGIEVGRVEKVNIGKNFNQVYFTSSRSLTPKSTFKFIANMEEKAVSTAFDLKQIESGKYMLTTTNKCDIGDKVNLIIDSKKEEEILSFSFKRDLDLELNFSVNNPMHAKITIDNKVLEVFGDTLEIAKNMPILRAQIEECFSKSQIFNARINDCIVEKVFIQKSKLNEFRRKVFESAKEYLVNKYKKDIKEEVINLTFKPIKKFTDFVFIEKESEFNQNIKEKNIIFSPEEYNQSVILTLNEKCKAVNKNLYLDLPNFALEEDIKLLKDIVYKTKVGVVANNYYALTFECDMVIGAGLNVYNDITASCYSYPILSTESENYGEIDYPYMTLRHCPIKAHIGGDCLNCKYQNGYIYKMQSGKELKLKRKKLSTCTFYLT